MSGIGFSELIILFLIGLIVLGPERLPRVANQLGTWLGQARRMTRVMKRQLEEEIDFDLEGKRPNIKPPPAQPAPHDDGYSPLHDPIPMADDAEANDSTAEDAKEEKEA
jgi:sec-independent protein translocase protein TatB